MLLKSSSRNALHLRCLEDARFSLPEVPLEQPERKSNSTSADKFSREKKAKVHSEDVSDASSGPPESDGDINMSSDELEYILQQTVAKVRAKVVPLEDFTDQKRAKFKKLMTTYSKKNETWTQEEPELTIYFVLVFKTQTMEEIEDILHKNKEKFDEHLNEKL